MASLRHLVRNNRDEITDGIAWVAIWKNGRSWDIHPFYYDDGSYEEGYTFEPEAVEMMEEILATDPKAICINGDYHPFGCDFTTQELEDKVFFFYQMRFAQLSEFLDCYVIH